MLLFLVVDVVVIILVFVLVVIVDGVVVDDVNVVVVFRVCVLFVLGNRCDRCCVHSCCGSSLLLLVYYSCVRVPSSVIILGYLLRSDNNIDR